MAGGRCSTDVLSCSETTLGLDRSVYVGIAHTCMHTLWRGRKQLCTKTISELLPGRIAFKSSGLPTLKPTEGTKKCEIDQQDASAKLLPNKTPTASRMANNTAKEHDGHYQPAPDKTMALTYRDDILSEVKAEAGAMSGFKWPWKDVDEGLDRESELESRFNTYLNVVSSTAMGSGGLPADSSPQDAAGKKSILFSPELTHVRSIEAKLLDFSTTHGTKPGGQKRGPMPIQTPLQRVVYDCGCSGNQCSAQRGLQDDRRRLPLLGAARGRPRSHPIHFPRLPEQAGLAKDGSRRIYRGPSGS
ncbi:hypothetical protein N656DRAFT_466045 [Canariomyces notabilis]|uniref:Uncharacterized protein n=1 Tax=Canariomyces notabilis TaxID=2074819 RepID=A0AAN6QFF5_9PEZI|nr:hypothetical protein N656DRAFT_466045 [Canariomyces arenarius]